MTTAEQSQGRRWLFWILGGTLLVMVLLGVLPYILNPRFVDRQRRQETVARMSLLMAAVRAYRVVAGADPPDRAVAAGPYDGNASMDVLLAHLKGKTAGSAPTARRIAAATRPFLQLVQGQPNQDGYSRPMRYYADRAVGGRPLLLSAGPDGDFGDEDKAKREDNIRSDRQK